MKMFALITARKNSQRLKKKHYLKINKKNLVERTYSFAKRIRFIQKVVLTTNDNFFLKYNFGDSLIKIKRPEKFSKKNSSSVSAILHSIRYLKKKDIKIDYILLLQPTSPFRSISSINNGYKLFKKFRGRQSVISVSKTENPIKKNFHIVKNRLIFRKYKNDKANYQINGNFYFASTKFLKKYKSFFKEKMTVPIFQKNKKLSLDIDTRRDYLLAKSFLRR